MKWKQKCLTMFELGSWSLAEKEKLMTKLGQIPDGYERFYKEIVSFRLKHDYKEKNEKA